MTSPAIDLLTAHFERMKGRRYAVPGIIDPATKAPLVIHFDPPTSARMARIKSRAGESEMNLTLYTVMEFARTADGQPMFEDNAATVQALTEGVSAKVLGGIAMAILASGADAESLGN